MLNWISELFRPKIPAPALLSQNNFPLEQPEGGIQSLSDSAEPERDPRHGQAAARQQAPVYSSGNGRKKREFKIDDLFQISEKIAAEKQQVSSSIDNAVRWIHQAFQYDQVAIYTPGKNPTTLAFHSGYNDRDGLLTSGQAIKFGHGMVGLVAQNRAAMRASNLLINPDASPGMFQVRSEMAVPILSGNTLIGVIDIQSPEVDDFSEDDEWFMRMVSGQIAAALENARLYEELRHELKEREQKENILRIQRDLIVKMSAASSLKDTLKNTLDVLSSELNVSRAVISLVDRETQSLIHGVSYNNALDRPALVPPLVNPEIAESVAKTGMSMIFQDTRYSKDSTVPLPPAIIYIPMRLDQKVIGVITMESGSGSVFSQEDIQGVSNLANSLVMLLERARLFEELQKARTELETRAEELEKANANLLELDRLKSQFLMNISHELRTPLNSIIGFSEVLIDGLAGSLNAEQSEYNQDILDSGRHLLELINNLLDFSKTSADKMDLRVSAFPVEKLFNDLKNAMTHMIVRKHQQLDFHLPAGPHLISADYLRLKQVFFNLISNANKFTQNYGRIEISCEMVSDDEILFEVKDSGIGIRAEDHDLIFEEFRQVDGSMTREVPGTGLGLTISRRIIEMHNGKIWVKSDLGQGSSFFVQIPIDYYAHEIDRTG